MQERNIINGTTTALVSPLLDFYENMIPFLLLAIVLIFVDSRFGVAAAKKRGEQIRPSRKWRRAINKLVDYICWVTSAGYWAYMETHNEHTESCLICGRPTKPATQKLVQLAIDG